MSEKKFSKAISDCVAMIAKATENKEEGVSFRNAIMKSLPEIIMSLDVITNKEIRLVSVSVKVMTLKEKVPQVNSAIQRYLISIAKNKKTKKFVQENMD